MGAVEGVDVLVRGGTLIDGSGAPARQVDLAIHEGKVLEMGPALTCPARQEIDATGRWVTPGFFDVHTHYDAEVEVSSGLTESLRHGVTTVVMGNCSLSTCLGSPDEILSLFTRVESLPREVLAGWLEGRVTWQGLAAYYDHLDGLPLGPNVASFLGHSSVRMAVMGLERALGVRDASAGELTQMTALVREGMELGYLGLSIDMLPWHRMSDAPHRGISVPSQQASPAEYSALAMEPRRFGRVLQATPNALDKRSVLRILGMSTGWLRKTLKTTVVAALDVKSNRAIYRLATSMARLTNLFGRGNVRFQALAEPFLNYADGPITPVMEELPAGVEAISARSASERRAMFEDPAYRARFRAQWTATGDRVFHRRLDDMYIERLPDGSMQGKSLAELARARGRDPVECFLDLLAEHDVGLRWRSVAANDRAAQRRYILSHPCTIPGFNDSGAHLRNMAFHDGALQMLRQAVETPDWISPEQAVHRLTRETAQWFGLPGGLLERGAVADLVVLDPARLPDGLGGPREHRSDLYGAQSVLVKRSDAVIDAVMVRGKVAYQAGQFDPALGQERCFGRLLRASA